MSKEIYTRLAVYKGVLTVEHTVFESNDVVVTPYDNPGVMGYVVKDVGHVGVSQEAYDFLKALRVGSDGLGDIDIFKSGDVHVFATLGGAYNLYTKDSETSRDYVVPPITDFQVIPNEVPEGAKEVIDSQQ